ncbi:C-type lectin domain family 10 member A-like [Mytilus californianus]|uniref:C-type lectin domain family 10 member A-like n=1 Tax=Mytilus californianus TaxID=6549 RepID=UPI002245D5FC|nr:C-type lectin domain family 10 member A-like [Mytilus californianus]
MMLTLHFVLLLLITEDVIGLPCLTNESKEDFDKSRKALTVVQSDIGKVVNTLESNHQQTIKTLESALKQTVSIMENNVKKTTDVLKNNLGTFKTTLNSMGQKIKKLDTDFKVLGKDFRKTKWIKYDGHCYYYSTETKDWFTAEKSCREIGGYLAKEDSTDERNNIYSNVNKSYNYWIGLTDLKEGEFRWTYDQSKTEVKNWHPGYGSKGTNNNCVATSYHASKLNFFDYSCSTEYQYICESNFCF